MWDKCRDGTKKSGIAVKTHITKFKIILIILLTHIVAFVRNVNKTIYEHHKLNYCLFNFKLPPNFFKRFLRNNQTSTK